MTADPVPPPAAEKLATLLPVADLGAAVDFYQQVLGIEPTFVDGGRWAQFDLGPTRLALAAADRTSDAAGIMVKVSDIDAAHAAATAAGLPVGPLEQGAHERRCLITSPDGHAVTLYAPT